MESGELNCYAKCFLSRLYDDIAGVHRVDGDTKSGLARVHEYICSAVEDEILAK